MNVGQIMKFYVWLLFLIVPVAVNAAQTIDFGAELCGAGSMSVDGACTENLRGKCTDGYYQIIAEPETFSGTSAGNQCAGAYSPATFSDWVQVMYSGTLMSFGATLCGAGQYLVNGTCKSYERGECPSNFYQMTTEAETITPINLDACDAGYKAADIAKNCADGGTSGGTCVVLCDAGLKYTGVGTCAAPCTAGVTKLRTSNGQNWPLYSMRQTTPSLVIKTDAGICYANLLPGTTSDTINIQTSADSTYHITD